MNLNTHRQPRAHTKLVLLTTPKNRQRIGTALDNTALLSHPFCTCFKKNFSCMARSSFEETGQVCNKPHFFPQEFGLVQTISWHLLEQQQWQLVVVFKVESFVSMEVGSLCREPLCRGDTKSWPGGQGRWHGMAACGAQLQPGQGEFGQPILRTRCWQQKVFFMGTASRGGYFLGFLLTSHLLTSLTFLS